MLLWSVQVGCPEAVMGRVPCVRMYMLTLSTGRLCQVPESVVTRAGKVPPAVGFMLKEK